MTAVPFRYDLAELKPEITNEIPNGLLVCETCLDIDHEQLQLGKFHIHDPEALQDPRPDLAKVTSQSLFGWRPVGDNVTLEATGVVGTVTVTTT